MRQDVFGETGAALRAVRSAGLLAGPYFGFKPPKLITGAYYEPAGFGQSGTPLTTTANRCYYVPFPVYEAHTFTAATFFNTGTGDTGKNVRIMMFNDDGAAGGPGSLAKDFGQVTLDNTSALRTLTSSWTAAVGMYWGAVWVDSVITSLAAHYPWQSNTNVGFNSGYNVNHAIGSLNASAFNGISTQAFAHYVDTAYGAAPGTAVAPTNSAQANIGAAAGTSPAFKLKA